MNLKYFANEHVNKHVNEIHQGPQDTIIFHIQNKKVGVNGQNFSMLFLQSLTLILGKRSSEHP